VTTHVYVYSDMLPQRCHGPLREHRIACASATAPFDRSYEIGVMRSGLSGKRWHEYAVRGAAWFTLGGKP
jgi:hypothetical protein